MPSFSFMPLFLHKSLSDKKGLSYHKGIHKAEMSHRCWASLDKAEQEQWVSLLSVRVQQGCVRHPVRLLLGFPHVLSQRSRSIKNPEAGGAVISSLQKRSDCHHPPPPTCYPCHPEVGSGYAPWPQPYLSHRDQSPGEAEQVPGWLLNDTQQNK